MTLIGRTQLRAICGGISTATSDRWEKKGVIPAAIRKPGMQPRWIKEDVVAALQQIPQAEETLKSWMIQ